MSWRSVREGASTSDKLTVVKSAVGNHEAKFNKYRSDFNGMMQKHYQLQYDPSCSQLDEQTGRIAETLLALSNEIDVTISSMANPGKDWLDLLYQAQKQTVQVSLRLNSSLEDFNTLYLLAIRNQLAMEDMGKMDVLIVRNTAELALRCGDKHTFTALLHQYQHHFQGIYRKLLDFSNVTVLASPPPSLSLPAPTPPVILDPTKDLSESITFQTPQHAIFYLSEVVKGTKLHPENLLGAICKAFDPQAWLLFSHNKLESDKALQEMETGTLNTEQEGPETYVTHEDEESVQQEQDRRVTRYSGVGIAPGREKGAEDDGEVEETEDIKQQKVQRHLQFLSFETFSL